MFYRIKLPTLILAFYGCIGVGLVFAQPAEAPTHYMGRELAQTMHWTGAPWLLRANRENEERVSELLREMHIEPGMTVCDVGSGNGYHSLKMARMVGESGEVLAVDIQPEMLELLQQRAAEAEIDNITPIQGLPDDPLLPPNRCDLILLVDVYHEITYPELMLAGMRKALSDRGLIVLVEYRAEDESVPIKPLHKMSKQQINKEYLANGFKLVREYDQLPWQHLMFFGRAETAPK